MVYLEYRRYKIFIMVVCVLVAAHIFFMPEKTLAAEYFEDQVGLNIHWTLGGFGYDHMYEYRLKESSTKWVREHFYNEVISLENPEGWFNRYDAIMKKYREMGVRVVGMLAYGETHGDMGKPDKEQWEGFVETVVARYAGSVDAWEVWNEPDSPDYLTPNNPETFGPILAEAYPIIKEHDPTSIVLAGGLASPNYGFLDTLYEVYGDSFDAPAFHVYYCGSYLKDASMPGLGRDLDKIENVINKRRQGDKAWITEIGCSTNGTSDAIQKNYLEAAHSMLFRRKWIERTFIYNIRDRDDTNNAQENNYGLLSRDLAAASPAWQWYLDIQETPYNKARKSLQEEESASQSLKRKVPKEYRNLENDEWEKLVFGYLYGGYPIKAIIQDLYFNDTTVNPKIAWQDWKNDNVYKVYIDKVPKSLQYAYAKKRISIAAEQVKSQELSRKIQEKYKNKNLKINNSNWGKLANAYIYGGYPVEAIARAVLFGGKTVNKSIPWSAWKNRKEYQETMKKKIP